LNPFSVGSNSNHYHFQQGVRVKNKAARCMLKYNMESKTFLLAAT